MKMLITFIRQILFLTLGTILRLPILGMLWILGKCGLIKVIFQVYPTDELETRGFCPEIPVLRKFFSGRPSLGGFIFDGMRLIGIYMVIPNTAQELVKKKNGYIAHNIVNRLARLAQLTGAESIGLAGQLGYIFEKRHKISIEKPFHHSIYGTVFSLSETIYNAIEFHKLSAETLKIGVLGLGEIGIALQEHLREKGFNVLSIDVKYTRKGNITLKDEKEAIPSLAELDLLVNLTPTGNYFLETNCHHHISPECILVDFSRPGISADIPHAIYMGNRTRRDGLQFALRLPGGWSRHTIPACSLASILATMTGATWDTFEGFCNIAKTHNFTVSLEQPVLIIDAQPQISFMMNISSFLKELYFGVSVAKEPVHDRLLALDKLR